MHRIFTKIILFLGTVASIAFGMTANATVVKKKSLDELVSDAPVVVIGTVMGVRYTQLKNTQKPYTETSIQLQEVITGADKLGRKKGDKIELFFAGGLSEKGYYEVIAGMPELQLGQTYLLLLRGGEWALNPISGWHQGAFRIVALNNRGAKLVLSLDDAALVGIDNNNLQFVSPDFNKRNILVESQDKNQAGLMIGGEYKAPVGQLKTAAILPRQEIPSAQLPQDKSSIYREDNLEELDASDRKRTNISRMEAVQMTREDATVKALGGAKPILLEQFLREIKKRNQKYNGLLQNMKFSLKPVPLQETIDGQAAPIEQKQNR
jgi:hypothetical protein